jgi:hypothetical protein
MESIKVYMTGEEKESVITGTPSVPKALSKTLVSKETGEIIYFVDKNYGLKHKLTSKMNFSCTHPIHITMCEITIPINRLD